MGENLRPDWDPRSENPEEYRRTASRPDWDPRSQHNEDLRLKKIEDDRIAAEQAELKKPVSERIKDQINKKIDMLAEVAGEKDPELVGRMRQKADELGKMLEQTNGYIKMDLKGHKEFDNFYGKDEQLRLDNYGVFGLIYNFNNFIDKLIAYFKKETTTARLPVVGNDTGDFTRSEKRKTLNFFKPDYTKKNVEDKDFNIDVKVYKSGLYITVPTEIPRVYLNIQCRDKEHLDYIKGTEDVVNQMNPLHYQISYKPQAEL